MSLGGTLFRLRREAGLSQEELADHLGVARQTVSKWEMDLSKPDLPRLQAISRIFQVSYETLLGESGLDPTENWKMMEAMAEQIDWTAAWAGKYPVLSTYPGFPGIQAFADRMDRLYAEFRETYGTNHQDTVLILKDLLYRRYRKDARASKGSRGSGDRP